jgi:hypothetical protein
MNRRDVAEAYGVKLIDLRRIDSAANRLAYAACLREAKSLSDELRGQALLMLAGGARVADVETWVEERARNARAHWAVTPATP